MLCKKCGLEIPESSKYCNHCGAKQIREKRGTRRGNGQGTVYKAADGRWVAEITLGWEAGDKLVRKHRRKTGLPTKKEALAYLPLLRQVLPAQDAGIRFGELYEKWLTLHAEKVSHATINCYKAAYKYLAPIHYAQVADIRTEHIQNCIDTCPHGTRTRENMKALCTALWRYAAQRDIVNKNYAEYVYIKKEAKNERTALSRQHLSALWDHSADPNVQYVLILCYTGLRLGELLCAKTADYHPQDGYFITGSKTAAGKNRVITISPKIRHFFRDMGTGEYLFFDQKPPTENWFRNKYFYPALQIAGIYDSDITPHCCRHTFATLMKDIDAPATDKQHLIGHAKFEMTAHYTHTDIGALKEITDKL